MDHLQKGLIWMKDSRIRGAKGSSEKILNSSLSGNSLRSQPDLQNWSLITKPYPFIRSFNSLSVLKSGSFSGLIRPFPPVLRFRSVYPLYFFVPAGCDTSGEVTLRQAEFTEKPLDGKYPHAVFTVILLTQVDLEKIRDFCSFLKIKD